MAKSADKASPPIVKGSFGDIFPSKGEWAAFVAGLAILMGAAAHAYEWGYGRALGFDVIDSISMTDHLSDWKYLWPVIFAMFCGRFLVPSKPDVSEYPDWVRWFRSTDAARPVLVIFLLLVAFIVVLIFIPGFREVHPNDGDDPTKLAAYLMVYLLIAFIGSPIVQFQMDRMGRIAYFALIIFATVLAAQFLGGQDGGDVMEQRGLRTWACLKGDEKTVQAPIEIVRSFGSGYITRSSGLFYWLDKKDAKGIGIGQPVDFRVPVQCEA